MCCRDGVKREMISMLLLLQISVLSLHHCYRHDALCFASLVHDFASHTLSRPTFFSLYPFLFLPTVVIIIIDSLAIPHRRPYPFHSSTTATTVWDAASSLANTTATFATSGCRLKSSHTTVTIVAFAASAGPTTFNTATFAACASTSLSLSLTIASLANTNPTVPSVKSTCFPHAAPLTKCLVATRFTGTAFVNWRLMTRVVQCVKRRQRLVSA
jgi:hypothetical protein